MWKTILSFFEGAPDTHSPSGAEQNRVAATTAPAIPVVALVLDDPDRELLTKIGRRDQLELRFTESCGQAWTLANQLGASIIFCDRDLPGAEWRDLVQILASAPQRPSVILTSRVVDDYLRQEVIRNGGYDVLAKPLREEDVVRSVRLARSYWNSASKRAPPVRR
jgi:CheY-like chemotaxis protein